MLRTLAREFARCDSRDNSGNGVLEAAGGERASQRAHDRAETPVDVEGAAKVKYACDRLRRETILEAKGEKQAIVRGQRVDHSGEPATQLPSREVFVEVLG